MPNLSLPTGMTFVYLVATVVLFVFLLIEVIYFLRKRSSSPEVPLQSTPQLVSARPASSYLKIIVIVLLVCIIGGLGYAVATKRIDMNTMTTKLSPPPAVPTQIAQADVTQPPVRMPTKTTSVQTTETITSTPKKSPTPTKKPVASRTPTPTRTGTTPGAKVTTGVIIVPKQPMAGSFSDTLLYIFTAMGVIGLGLLL